MSKHAVAGPLLTVLAVSAACCVATAARAADFYAGRTIDFIVGTDAGGGFDAYARAIARHLPRFIPGAPTVVVQNMPGAGSAKAAAYIYGLAPKDGTAIGALFPGVIIDPLLQQRPAGQFDVTRFNYLASADSDPRVCITGPSSKIKTFEQALTEKTVIGASASGGSTSDYAYMQNNAAGAKFEIVGGYKGTADIMLAIERGEIEGVCGLDWSSLKAQRPQWLRDKTVNILVQDTPEPNPELTALNVPNVETFIKSELDRKAVALIVSQQIFSRPYVAPPDTPAEQTALLQQGLAAVLHDPGFLSDAAAAHLSIDPTSGDKVKEAVVKLYGTSGDVVQRARQLIASPNGPK